MYLKILEICELDPTRFLTSQGLAWQTAFKKTKVNLELLTDIDILLMIEEGIRCGIFHAIHRYVKANNKWSKVFKNEPSEICGRQGCLPQISLGPFLNS